MLVDERHPFFYDKENKEMHQLALGRLVVDGRFQSVFAQDGVYVFKRVAPDPSAPSGAGTPPTPSPTPLTPPN